MQSENCTIKNSLGIKRKPNNKYETKKAAVDLQYMKVKDAA